MKILIVRLSSMGDVILATALFSFLRKQYPTASLTFLTGSDYAGLFRDDPRLSEVAAIHDSAAPNCRRLSPHPHGTWSSISRTARGAMSCSGSCGQNPEPPTF